MENKEYQPRTYTIKIWGPRSSPTRIRTLAQIGISGQEKSSKIITMGLWIFHRIGSMKISRQETLMELARTFQKLSCSHQLVWEHINSPKWMLIIIDLGIICLLTTTQKCINLTKRKFLQIKKSIMKKGSKSRDKYQIETFITRPEDKSRKDKNLEDNNCADPINLYALCQRPSFPRHNNTTHTRAANNTILRNNSQPTMILGWMITRWTNSTNKR